VEGGKQQRPKLVYELSVPSLDTIVGAFWFMRTANVWVVQRTFGLIEALGKEVHGSAISTSERKAQVDQMRYGPNFMYDEFMEQPSKLTAMFTSTFLFLGIAMVSLFSPVCPSSTSLLCFSHAPPGTLASQENAASVW
jgi:hypothetical protein